MKTLLLVSGVAKSTFYYHLKIIKQVDKDKILKELISKIFKKHKSRYGYRRISAELKKLSIIVNHKKIRRLMRELSLSKRPIKKSYKVFEGDENRSIPNILDRDFNTDGPNKKWATDITEFRVGSQKLFLSPIIDLYNLEIISYTLSENQSLKMVNTMLERALKQVKDTSELMIHSDQSWHYRHRIYQNILEEQGITQSMSRKGNCLDNAVIENFFGLLKKEMFYSRKFKSISDLKHEINCYISYYNKDRIKKKLNWLSPIDYRTQSIC